LNRRWVVASAVLGSVLLVIVVANRTGKQASSVSMPLNATSAPKVMRMGQVTFDALSAASVDLGLSAIKTSDTWYEPACRGAGVFVSTNSGPVWNWYDEPTHKITQQLFEQDIRAKIGEKVAVTPTAVDWKFTGAGTAQRPSYLVGVELRSGSEVWLTLNTETCSIFHGSLERIGKSGKREPISSVTFEQPARPSYQAVRKSQPAVVRRGEQTQAAYEEMKKVTGITANYAGEAWLEPACNAVLVYQETDDRQEWGWYDLSRLSIVQHASRTSLLESLRKQFPEIDLRTGRFASRQDGPGGRTRYLVGFSSQTLRDAWLHLDTANCSILSGQVQFAKDLNDPGTFQPISLQ